MSTPTPPAATGLPFDDVRALFALLPEADAAALAAVRARDAELVKPAGALGRLETLVEWLAAWQATATPHIDRPLVAVFAGSHGVAARGVSAYPPAVTRQMLDTIAAGGAAINQLCATYDLGLKAFDLAVDVPTGDIAETEALDEAGCAATIAFGMEAIAGGIDLLGLGEIGIGNTTAAAAVAAALCGGPVTDFVGRGTGLDDAGLARKQAVVAQALATHAGALSDPLEVLRRLGGREIAAAAGAILAARLQRVPVVLDGYVVTAAAAVLHAMAPSAIAHCLAAHVSAEPGHRLLLAHLGLQPVLDLGLRLGEGSGAALAIGLLKAALACHRDMVTFAQAGVAGRV